MHLQEIKKSPVAMAGLFSMIKSNEYLFLCARSVTCVQAVYDFLCDIQ